MPAVGTALSTSRVSTCCLALLWTSTTGDAPETVTLSCSVPTVRSMLTVATKFAASSKPSRTCVLNPVSWYLRV